MSETDKYAAAVDAMGDLYLNQEDDVAAAYLREHFVTREEYEAVKAVLFTDLNDDTIATLTAERDRLRAALVRLRDCDWVISLPDRMDAVRDIARQALNPEDV